MNLVADIVTHVNIIQMFCNFGRKGVFVLIAIFLICLAVTVTTFSRIFAPHSPSLSLHNADSVSVPCLQQKTVLRTRFPDALIIGVRKGGTRALINFLSTHPRVVKAKGEVHFFDKADKFNRGINYYLSQLPPVQDGSILLEKTPAYFITPTAPDAIHLFHPGVKLILIVRDPVDRIVSSYAQLLEKHVQKGESYPDLPDMIYLEDGSVNLSHSMVQTSLYSRHLRNWLKVFPREQVHIVDGDSFARNPYSAMKDMEEFLQLETFFTKDSFHYNASKGFYCVQVGQELECLGSGKGREHPEVEERVIKDLRKVFAPYNEEFEKMTGLSFGWST